MTDIFLSAEDLRARAIDEYLDVVEPDTISEVLPLFCETASFTLYPSGTEYVGHEQIREMYEHVFSLHDKLERRLLDIVIDVENQSVAASFDAVSLNKKAMKNVNFWKFRNGKFASVKVFTSNSEL